MINSIAIVDVGWKRINPENPTGEALGGSETWLVQISKEFSYRGYVDVYCDIKQDYYRANDNLVFINANRFLLNKKQYDFVILNRFFEKDGVNYIQYIKENHIAKHVYIQIHDLSFIVDGQLLKIGEDVNKFHLNDDFVTIVTLNEWHRSNLLAQYTSLVKKPICIPNGLDLSLFHENTEPRDNRILWSSCAERGLDILINDIYPLVKEQIPDFGVDIASYNEYKMGDTDKDVKYLGRLSKEELYKEQSKHKVWFYPGTFAETFCITMLENIINGAQVVSPFTYGTRATIKYGDTLGMKNRFDNSNTYQKAVQEAANKIIEILKTDGTRPKIYDDYIVPMIKREYHWCSSANMYEGDFFIKNHYDKPNRKKILIMSMSCNQPFFKALLGAVRDTWAKKLLFNQYEDCTWFAYTSCDKKHPTPYVDFKEHMVYVDCDDNIFNTYEKTKKAYNLIKNAGVKFDYVVRTNTSVYVNIDKMIEKVNKTPNDTVLGGMVGYYHKYPDGHMQFMWNILVGLFFGMSREYFDIAMSATNNYDTIPTSDDVIISGKLHEVYGELKYTSPNPNCPTTFPRYKSYLPGDEDAKKIHTLTNTTFTDDPQSVNNNVVVQIRTLYGDLPERAEKGHELEHFYELYDAQD